MIPLSAGPRSVPPPPGWKWRKLTELARLESGHTPSRRHPEWWGGDIPWIALPDIRALDGKLAFDTAEHINEDGIAHSAARHFLAMLFRASRDLIRSLGSGAVHKTVYVPTVEDFYVCVPPLEIQKLIIRVVEAEMVQAERARAAAEAQVEAARALASSLRCTTFRSSEVSKCPRQRLGALAPNDEAFADGPFGSYLKTEHYSKQGARVIRLQNIGQGTFLNEDKVYVSIDHYRMLERHSAKQGDVVVAALGDGARPAGRACVLPSDLGPALVKADCFRVRLPEEIVVPDYLAAYLNSPDCLRRMAEALRGATRPRLTLSMLRQVDMPLPPVAEQRRTVSKLNEQLAKADHLLRTLEGDLAAIRILPESLLDRAFSGEL